jgi:hypothetical protein
MDEALLGAGEVAIVTRAFLLLEAWPHRAMVATDRFVLRGIAVLLFCARPVGSLLRGEGSTAGPFH